MALFYGIKSKALELQKKIIIKKTFKCWTFHILL